MRNLEPRALWNYFYEITRIPRPSKKEERMTAYLKAFADKLALPVKVDAAGNVLISKAASPGYEKAKTIILQSHQDMVCEKNSDVEHNFDTDPIDTYIDGDWLKAKGTTLGADNGIGMAMALAILADKDLQHPRIECLFTVDEETGLTGAAALTSDFMTGTALINLDSEDDGEIFIGCAGACDAGRARRRSVPFLQKLHRGHDGAGSRGHEGEGASSPAGPVAGVTAGTAAGGAADAARGAGVAGLDRLSPLAVPQAGTGRRAVKNMHAISPRQPAPAPSGAIGIARRTTSLQWLASWPDPSRSGSQGFGSWRECRISPASRLKPICLVSPSARQPPACGRV